MGFSGLTFLVEGDAELVWDVGVIRFQVAWN